MTKYVDNELGKFSYDDQEYEVLTDVINEEYLHYIGSSNKPIQPVGYMFIFDRLFEGINDLKIIDLSGWDISNIKSMYRMFFGCSMLKEIIGINDWDLSKLKNKHKAYVFVGCDSLKKYPDWYTKIYPTKKHSGSILMKDGSIQFESIQSKKKFEQFLMQTEYRASKVGINDLTIISDKGIDDFNVYAVGIRKGKAYAYSIREKKVYYLDEYKEACEVNHLDLINRKNEGDIFNIIYFTSYQSKKDFKEYLKKITIEYLSYNVIGVRNGKCYSYDNDINTFYKHNGLDTDKIEGGYKYE